MIRKGVVVCSLLCFPVWALQESPWLGNTYQMEMDVREAYQVYRHIDHAFVQPSHSYRSYITQTSLLASPAPDWEVELEVELARTPYQLYGFRSAAGAFRFLFWDDNRGDPCALALGAIFRGVRGRSVHDVSSPYASYMNYELFGSCGKDLVVFSPQKVLKGFMMLSLGLPNQGALWDRGYAELEYRKDASSFLIFTSAYVGYGASRLVDLSHFTGWSHQRHGNVDLGASYRFHSALWGTLSCFYSYRVYAYSYPQNTQTIELSYILPFSLF